MKSNNNVGWYPDDSEELTPVVNQSIAIIDDQPDDWSGLYDAAGRKLMHPRQPFGFRIK